MYFHPNKEVSCILIEKMNFIFIFLFFIFFAYIQAFTLEHVSFKIQSAFIWWLLTNFNQFSNKDRLLRIGSNFFKSSSNMTLYEARSRSWRFQHITMRDPLLCNGLKSFLIFSMWRCVALYFVMVSTSLLIFSMWQCVTLYFVMVSNHF